MEKAGQLGPSSLRHDPRHRRWSFNSSSKASTTEGQSTPLSPPTTTRHGERHLLLVEDDADLRASLGNLLRNDGYHVVDASNGSEALECLRKGATPDLILLDLMMPVKDGWQFRIEQKRDPGFASIPVLALSADDSAKAAAIDAAAYIKKPFQYATLHAAIERVMEERRLAHLDRLASLGTLAAGIAHEINNPLTYLIANLQLLHEEMPQLLQAFKANSLPHLDLEQPGSEVAARFHEASARLRDALDGAERIRGVVSDVRTFSRAGYDHRASVDIRSVIDSSLRVVASEVRQRARVVKDYQPIPLVLASPGQLGQVFLNLLLNAAHAIERGGPEKNTIRVATRTTPKGQILVEIADTGCGIEPDVQSRIFDPFFSTKPVGVGTGLGLSICHGIVRSLGGTITVESKVGEGATFRVTLPPSPGEDITAPSDAALSPLPALRGKVLIVDDEDRVAHAVRAMISADHETQVITKGTKALALLVDESNDADFDLILCDLHMPEMSGMDLYDKLSKLRPAVAERLVFMTGGMLTDRSREFVRRIGNACIDKPIDIARLRNLISASVARRQS